MKKRILILGGTNFVGRNFVEELVRKEEYEITLFNRGLTNTNLFPGIKRIAGDRESGDMEKLIKNEYDCVLDFSSYFPGSLQRLISTLKDKTQRYIYISTISVFDRESTLDLQILTENASTLSCSPEQMKDTSLHSYGERKAECERIVLNENKLDSIIFRPSIIYGPYDHTDRLYYWLYRIRKQREILIPSNHQVLLNTTYVKDFVKVLSEAITIKQHHKIYNIPTHQPNTFKQKLETITAQFKTSPAFVEIGGEKMEKEQVQPWMDIPLYIPYHRSLSNETLLSDFKYELTPFDRSIKETIDHYDQFEWQEGKYGLTTGQEKKIIQRLSSPLRK